MLHAKSHRDHRRAAGADHTAYKREHIFQVDTEKRRLCNSQVTGDACRYVDLLRAFILLLEKAHCEDAGALRDIGQSDHRPQDRAVRRCIKEL